MKHRRSLFALTLFLLTGCHHMRDNLIVATTTSTYDSGLMTTIIPTFEEQYHIKVDLLSVGTGEALRLGKRGDVDVLLAHAREKEDRFIAEGDGINRQNVMCNDFVIVGPVHDPADIRGEESAADALAKIADAKADFFSRGDQSGTHSRELLLWNTAGVVPMGAWYHRLGQGMGATLTLANEQQAYTLVDSSTYWSREDVDLVVMVEDDRQLHNIYGVMMVNPARHDIDQEAAGLFIDWLVSDKTQLMINSYTVNNIALFRTDCHT